MVGQKVMVRLTDNWKSEIPAIILAVVPTAAYKFNPISTQKDIVIEYTCAALVKLESFDKGAIYQLPWHLIEMRDEA